ncbi:MAG: tetratricopeptide (TPR) repeat protein, partial [Crocinitomicaceae bacterium]
TETELIKLMKMKFAKTLIVAATLLIGFTSTAQDDPDRECKRMRFLAGEAVTAENYIDATKYYHLAEKLCGPFDAPNFERLIGSLTNAINGIVDEKAKLPYYDSIISAYERQTAAGFYKEESDFALATHLLMIENPNRKKADTLYRRGIKAAGTSTLEGYVSYFYYNVYMIYYDATGEEQTAWKKRMISDYFDMSKLVTAAKMSAQTQESLTSYLNYVVESCEDILPEVPGFLESLPKDPEAKKTAINDMITLLESKDCTSSDEFMNLVDTLIGVDPNSIETLEVKAKLLMAQNKCNEAIEVYKQIKSVTEDADKKHEMQYNITYCLFKMGSYASAYSSAMSVGGKFKGDALVIASDCVARRANSCGVSTFERDCNYLYAAQLAAQGQANGGNAGNRVASFNANAPTADEKFNEGNPSSVTLSCYGVTVNP